MSVSRSAIGTASHKIHSSQHSGCADMSHSSAHVVTFHCPPILRSGPSTQTFVQWKHLFAFDQSQTNEFISYLYAYIYLVSIFRNDVNKHTIPANYLFRLSRTWDLDDDVNVHSMWLLKDKCVYWFPSLVWVIRFSHIIGVSSGQDGEAVVNTANIKYLNLLAPALPQTLIQAWAWVGFANLDAMIKFNICSSPRASKGKYFQ